MDDVHISSSEADAMVKVDGSVDKVEAADAKMLQTKNCSGNFMRPLGSISASAGKADWREDLCRIIAPPVVPVPFPVGWALA